MNKRKHVAPTYRVLEPFCHPWNIVHAYRMRVLCSQVW